MNKLIDESQLSIYILTSVFENRHYAMVATWISPASLRLDETRFTLALSKFNHSTKSILSNQQFMIHRLPKSEFMTAYRMGLNHSEDVDKFQNEKFEIHPTGLRVLLNASIYAHCNVLSSLETDDRFILYCSTLEVSVLNKSELDLTHEALFAQLGEDDRQKLSKKYLSDCNRDTP